MDINIAFQNIHYIESLTRQKSPIHRLDPRTKVITTLIFIGVVISFPKYEIIALLPFFLFPLCISALGNIPFSYILKRIMFLSPFILFIGIFNPLLDKKIIIIGSIEISKGWFSFFSLTFRFILTISSALLLIATTGFSNICKAFAYYRIPSIFILQLLLVYRYIFLLIEESLRAIRAKSLRDFEQKMNLKTFGSLVGTILIRCIDRSRRIYTAMLSRGFSQEIHMEYPFHMHCRDYIFILCCTLFFIIMKMYPSIIHHIFRKFAL